VTDSIQSAGKLDPVNLQSGSQLRALNGAELARLGEESLRTHMVDMAIVAHAKYVPLTSESLAAFLDDRNNVRYPVEIVYDIGSMAPHQFAQPEPDGDGYKLYLHPELKGMDGDVAMAIAYFIPVINFGDLVNDEHCLLYGATLSGLTADEYYGELCRIADSMGVSSRERSEVGSRF
jgi:hypothetical protein